MSLVTVIEADEAACETDALFRVRSEMPAKTFRKFMQALQEPNETRWVLLLRFTKFYELEPLESVLLAIRECDERHGDSESLLSAYIDLLCAKELVSEQRMMWGVLWEFSALITMLVVGVGIIYVCVVDIL